MKTICHINTTFLHKAGSARRTFAVIRSLADKNYEVIQIVGRDFEPQQDWDLTGIEFIQITNLVKYINPVRDLIAFLKLYKILKQYRPQIVHTHLAKAGFLGRLAARLAKIPIIIHTVHGPTFPSGIHPIKRYVYRFLERFCSKFTHKFVFVGEEIRDEYVRNKICPTEKTVVIRSGRPQSDFSAADKITQDEIKSVRKSFSDEQGVFLIGYVARLVPSKAQDVAIRILKEIREKGVDGHLVLIGEGHLPEEKKYETLLKRLIIELNLSKYVHFTGYQYNVFLYMKVMDVLILPSRYEGLPNIAIEAGIVGKPMVSYDVCGIHEVIRNNITGYIVKQGDYQNMAEKLIFLAQNSEIARAMGKSAQFEIRELYNMDKMLKDKLKFYESFLK